MLYNRKELKCKQEELEVRKNFRKIRTLAIKLVIIAIGLISFVGIYAKKLNSYSNLLPDYQLEVDLFGKKRKYF